MTNAARPRAARACGWLAIGLGLGLRLRWACCCGGAGGRGTASWLGRAGQLAQGIPWPPTLGRAAASRQIGRGPGPDRPFGQLACNLAATWPSLALRAAAPAPALGSQPRAWPRGTPGLTPHPARCGRGGTPIYFSTPVLRIRNGSTFPVQYKCRRNPCLVLHLQHLSGQVFLQRIIRAALQQGQDRPSKRGVGSPWLVTGPAPPPGAWPVQAHL